MKCPECGYRQRVRNGMACDQCKYSFLFNPKTDSGLTDGKFLAAINRASQQGNGYFTKNQAYSAFILNSKHSVWVFILLGLFLVGFFSVWAILLGGGFAWMLPVIGMLIAVGLYLNGPILAINSQQFGKYIDQWSQRRPLAYLLTAPRLHEPPPQWHENDIYDYGVERILVVQRDELVDLLVMNQIHVQQKTLIFAESGYPVYISGRVAGLLTERLDLPIFVLHDADRLGCGTLQRLKDAYWLPNQGGDSEKYRWIECGLFPEDFQKIQQLSQVRYWKKRFELPVDTLLMTTLSQALAASFLAEASIGELLQRSIDGGGADSSGGILVSFDSDFG